MKINFIANACHLTFVETTPLTIALAFQTMFTLSLFIVDIFPQIHQTHIKSSQDKLLICWRTTLLLSKLHFKQCLVRNTPDGRQLLVISYPL